MAEILTDFDGLDSREAAAQYTQIPEGFVLPFLIPHSSSIIFALSLLIKIPVAS